MATPRDLDKNAPKDVENVLDETEETMITYRVQYIDPATGQAAEKVHGPMPRSKWEAYAKENGL